MKNLSIVLLSILFLIATNANAAKDQVTAVDNSPHVVNGSPLSIKTPTANMGTTSIPLNAPIYGTPQQLTPVVIQPKITVDPHVMPATPALNFEPKLNLVEYVIVPVFCPRASIFVNGAPTPAQVNAGTLPASVLSAEVYPPGATQAAYIVASPAAISAQVMNCYGTFAFSPITPMNSSGVTLGNANWSCSYSSTITQCSGTPKASSLTSMVKISLPYPEPWMNSNNCTTDTIKGIVCKH